MKKKIDYSKSKTVYFRKDVYLSARTCMKCEEIVVDGMYVHHAKTKHGTGRVGFKDDYSRQII